MKLRIFAITVAFLVILSLSEAHAQAIRIMPLGDSITSGSGEIVNNSYKVGYRQALWQYLIGSGYEVNFVGSLRGGDAISGFDADHEGHGGWCADGCNAPYLDIRDYIYGFLVNNPADVVLLHIGTNDIQAGQASSAEVSGILDEIYRYGNNNDREIWVVLARIVNLANPPCTNCQATTNFNIQLGIMAQQRIQNGDRLFVVDMESGAGIDYRLNPMGDMWDTLHPYATGYAKMADVWFDALKDILPTPTRTLTLQKSGAGEGVVMSTPKSIDCGNSCTDSFSYGTVVTLTATPGHGCAFSDWAGCDSANGNTCTVTMNSDRTVTAVFRLVTEVKLLSPNGGEIIQAGSEYPLSWEAPREATKFKLSSSPGGKIGIVVSENAIMWDVPLVKKNITKGFVKVTAYDSSNKKVGFDTSDSIFTIEGARITFPNEGNTCVGGETCTITWTKSENVPAVSAELSYSLNDGRSWKKIPEILPGDAGALDWAAPVVSEPETRCKVRVVLKGSNGRKVGSDESDGAFTIQPAP